MSKFFKNKRERQKSVKINGSRYFQSHAPMRQNQYLPTYDNDDDDVDVDDDDYDHQCISPPQPATSVIRLG